MRYRAVLIGPAAAAVTSSLQVTLKGRNPTNFPFVQRLLVNNHLGERRVRQLVAGLATMVTLISGCGAPFGPCYSEAVEVALNGTLDGAAIAVTGQVAPGNTPTFAGLRQVLIDGSAIAGQQVVWTVDGLGGDGYLTVQLPANLTSGRTFQLDQVFVGGGWGLGPGGGTPAVSARFGPNQASAVSGTIVVLRAAPLQLRLDLTLRDAQNPNRRFAATATFSYRREETPCT